MREDPRVDRAADLGHVVQHVDVQERPRRAGVDDHEVIGRLDVPHGQPAAAARAPAPRRATRSRRPGASPPGIRSSPGVRVGRIASAASASFVRTWKSVGASAALPPSSTSVAFAWGSASTRSTRRPELGQADRRVDGAGRLARPALLRQPGDRTHGTSLPVRRSATAPRPLRTGGLVPGARECPAPMAPWGRGPRPESPRGRGSRGPRGRRRGSTGPCPGRGAPADWYRGAEVTGALGSRGAEVSRPLGRGPRCQRP